jgi:hypothetical protein
LYHGTIYDFTTIDVRRGKAYKDFGQGFYTTQSYDHAKNIAERNRRIELELQAAYGRSNDASIFIYEYSLIKSELSNLNVKWFTNP